MNKLCVVWVNSRLLYYLIRKIKKYVNKLKYNQGIVMIEKIDDIVTLEQVR